MLCYRLQHTLIILLGYVSVDKAGIHHPSVRRLCAAADGQVVSFCDETKSKEYCLASGFYDLYIDDFPSWIKFTVEEVNMWTGNELLFVRYQNDIPHFAEPG